MKKSVLSHRFISLLVVKYPIAITSKVKDMIDRYREEPVSRRRALKEVFVRWPAKVAAIGLAATLLGSCAPSEEPTAGPTADPTSPPTTEPEPLTPTSPPPPAATEEDESYPFSQEEREKSAEKFLNLYPDWHQRYVTSEGTLEEDQLRVRMPETWGEDATTSESMGYGMLLSAFAGDQATFDALWRYTRNYLVPGTNLMHWRVDSEGNLSSEDGNLGSATDGDMDIATALIFASRIWGDEAYEQEAVNIINDLAQFNLEPDTFVLKPGDEWGGSNIVCTSYLSPAQFRLFAEVTGDKRWSLATETAYRIYENIASRSGSVLMPNGATATGEAVAGAWEDVGYLYGYNATRAPIRLSWASLWDEDPQAATILSGFNSFWEQIPPSEIVDGYSLDGTPTGEYHVGSFVAPVAAASITSEDPAYRSSIYDQMTIMFEESYFSDSLSMLTLASLGGIPEQILSR